MTNKQINEKEMVDIEIICNKYSFMRDVRLPVIVKGYCLTDRICLIPSTELIGAGADRSCLMSDHPTFCKKSWCFTIGEEVRVISYNTFDFGDYALIEQKRFGCENEMFSYKVISQIRSNTWVDVPVKTPEVEVIHDTIEDVCLCICCGVDETSVKRFRVKDMKPLPSRKVQEKFDYNTFQQGYSSDSDTGVPQ